MKTTKKEQLRRRREFEKVYKRYNELNDKAHDFRSKGMANDIDYSEEINEIFESEEYKILENTLLFGPTDDISREDMENPDYKDIFGVHPLSDMTILELWKDGIYGKHVKFKELGLSGVVVCLAYDYSENYYKVLPDNEDEPIYITLIDNYATD